MFRFIRRYNHIAFAVVLTWAIILLAAVSYLWWESTDDHYQDVTWNDSPQPSITGEEIETPTGTITIYKAEAPSDFEAERDLRYVSMATGKVASLADDPEALVYGEKAVGKLGRIGLVKTGIRAERPVFDLVFVSFPDLERFLIAKSVDSLDTVQQLDNQTFSAIVWYKKDLARFHVIDAQTGKIEISRDLGFSQSPSS